MNSFTVSFKGFAKTIYYLFYFQNSLFQTTTINWFLKKIVSADIFSLLTNVSKKIEIKMMILNKNKPFAKFVVSFPFIPNNFGC